MDPPLKYGHSAIPAYPQHQNYLQQLHQQNYQEQQQTQPQEQQQTQPQQQQQPQQQTIPHQNPFHSPSPSPVAATVQYTSGIAVSCPPAQDPGLDPEPALIAVSRSLPMLPSGSNKRKRVDAVSDGPPVLQNTKRPTSTLHSVQPPNETIFKEGSERELWLVEQLKLPRYHLPLRQMGPGSSSKKKKRSSTDSSDTLVTKAQVYKDLAAAFNKKRFKKPNGVDVYETPKSGNGIKTKVIDLIKDFEEAHTMAKKKTGFGSTDEATWQQQILVKCRYYFALEQAFGQKHSAEVHDVYADSTVDMSQPYPPGPDWSDSDADEHTGTESGVESDGAGDETEVVPAPTGPPHLSDTDRERSASVRPTRDRSASALPVARPSSGAKKHDSLSSMSDNLSDVLAVSRETAEANRLMAKAKADMVLIERERVGIERMKAETERRRMEEEIRLKEKELEMHVKLEIEKKRMELEHQLKLRSAEKIVLSSNEVAVVRGSP